MIGDFDFWDAMDRLVSSSTITIDRPKGSGHPRYPGFVYGLDYGYLEGTPTVPQTGQWISGMGSPQ